MNFEKICPVSIRIKSENESYDEVSKHKQRWSQKKAIYARSNHAWENQARNKHAREMRNQYIRERINRCVINTLSDEAWAMRQRLWRSERGWASKVWRSGSTERYNHRSEVRLRFMTAEVITASEECSDRAWSREVAAEKLQQRSCNREVATELGKNKRETIGKDIFKRNMSSSCG